MKEASAPPSACEWAEAEGGRTARPGTSDSEESLHTSPQTLQLTPREPQDDVSQAFPEKQSREDT